MKLFFKSPIFKFILLMLASILFLSVGEFVLKRIGIENSKNTFIWFRIFVYSLSAILGGAIALPGLKLWSRRTTTFKAAYGSIVVFVLSLVYVLLVVKYSIAVGTLQ